MAWYLNRALTNFRVAVDAAYPRRDKTSDGTIGDAAHQSTVSDHNPDSDDSVDAWDMDVELLGPGQPYAANVELLKLLFQLHPSSQYWIHDGQIASRRTGWKREPYSGLNRHEKHVHWNTREAYEDSNAPWDIGGSMEFGATQDNALRDCLNILTGMANGLAEVAVHDRDGKLSLTGLWGRLQSPPVPVDPEALKALIREVVREELDNTKLSSPV